MQRCWHRRSRCEPNGARRVPTPLRRSSATYALGHSPITRDDALDIAVRACADRGAVVREIGWPDKFAALAEAQRIVQVFETARAFAIEFEQNRDQLSPPLVALIEEGQSIGTETYLTALRTGRECAGSVDELFGAADIVLAPSAPGEAPRGLHSTGDPQFNRAWHLLGAPQINAGAECSASRSIEAAIGRADDRPARR